MKYTFVPFQVMDYANRLDQEEATREYIDSSRRSRYDSYMSSRAQREASPFRQNYDYYRYPPNQPQAKVLPTCQKFAINILFWKMLGRAKQTFTYIGETDRIFRSIKMSVFLTDNKGSSIF